MNNQRSHDAYLRRVSFTRPLSLLHKNETCEACTQEAKEAKEATEEAKKARPIMWPSPGFDLLGNVVGKVQ